MAAVPEGARLHRARSTPELVDVPELRFLMIDGSGDPNHAPGYQAALQTLFSLSYALKFASKHTGGPDWKVAPLEGLWDVDPVEPTDKSVWTWTMMIAQPHHVTAADVAAVAHEAATKRRLSADGVRLEDFTEGLSAQVLHVGRYADEAPTIERLHAFIEERGYVRRGRHHEIYLGDPRRAAPERLKTIIRQPVAER